MYEVTNLEALLDLLDENDDDNLIAKAEVYRELSRFDEAIRLLGWDDKSEDSSFIALIRQLAREQDPYVREFIDRIDQFID